MRKRGYTMVKINKRTNTSKKKDVPFKSKHNLMFEVAEWEFSPEFKRFRIGTCTGLWRSTEDSYDILAVDNDVKGNGHFEDVMEWFENSCIRDKRALRVLAIYNPRLKNHLLNKRDFVAISDDNVEKITFKTK